jgi:hypothetical protein
MLSQLRATDSSWCIRQWATLSVALYLTGRLRSLGLDHSWGQCHHEMRRHDTYCSNFSCTSVTLAAGLRPGARRAMGLPSNRSRPVTKSGVPTDRPVPSANRRSPQSLTSLPGASSYSPLSWRKTKADNAPQASDNGKAESQAFGIAA